MRELVVNSRRLSLNDNGFLADPADWDEDVAKSFAKIQGIELTIEHWQVIFYLRNYWQQFGIAPMLRRVCKEIGISLDKLMELFSPGPLKIACKIAGLPQPQGCI